MLFRSTGLPVATLKGHSSTISSLSFSPEDSRLASGSRDKTVRLWECATGRRIAILRDHSKPVDALSFSPDGSRLASGSLNNMRLWDGATGRFLGTLDTRPEWYSSCTVPCGTTISQGESQEAFRSYGIQCTLPNTNDPIPLLWLPADTAPIERKEFCGKSAAFGCKNGQVIILDLSKLNL